MTPAFLTDLEVRLISSSFHKRQWQLVAPLRYKTFIYGNGTPWTVLEVPMGFVTDFASVPRIPVVWWMAGALAQRPAVVHDYLYRTQKTSRKLADAIFNEAMQVDGGKPVRRVLMYWAVRLFGRSAYNENNEV